MRTSRHRLSGPSASDLAEIASGKGSARDKAEARGGRSRRFKSKRHKLR